MVSSILYFVSIGPKLEGFRANPHPKVGGSVMRPRGRSRRLHNINNCRGGARGKRVWALDSLVGDWICRRTVYRRLIRAAARTIAAPKKMPSSATVEQTLTIFARIQTSAARAGIPLTRLEYSCPRSNLRNGPARSKKQ